MNWLNVKFDVIEIATNSMKLFGTKTDVLFYRICDWLKKNIYCSSESTRSLIKIVDKIDFFNDECKPYSAC